MLSAYLFRGYFYRLTIAYQITATRPSYNIHNDSLSSYIAHYIKGDQEPDVRSLTNLALQITADKLFYRSSNTLNDPNQLIMHQRAHCVGYASFTATVCNTLFRKFKLNDWKALPVAGQLYFLGINVHPWFNSPFFSDHDFVLIENKVTGERILADPTVSDYLDINFVTERIKP
jgi:hypothetical protein